MSFVSEETPIEIVEQKYENNILYIKHKGKFVAVYDYIQDKMISHDIYQIYYGNYPIRNLCVDLISYSERRRDWVDKYPDRIWDPLDSDPERRRDWVDKYPDRKWDLVVSYSEIKRYLGFKKLNNL